MSERNPVFLTTRKYHKALDQRDEARRELAEYRDLEPFLKIAHDIHDEVVNDISTTPEGQQRAMNLATDMARDRYRQEVIQDYARQKRVELEDEDTARIRQEVIEQESERINREVADEVARHESSRRQSITNSTEYELKNLRREELLARIDSDEARKTLERFGAVALKKAQHEALVEELKVKAQSTSSIEIADIPSEVVLKVGLASPTEKRQSYQARPSVDSCDRVLMLRVLEPNEGIVEIMGDSWSTSTDSVRRLNAIYDLEILHMPRHANGLSRPRFSRDVEPDFSTEEGKHVNMYGLEVQVATIGDQAIF